MGDEVTANRPSLGIRIDGEDAGVIFSFASDAIWSAQKLAQHGYRNVSVFNRKTGRAITAMETRRLEHANGLTRNGPFDID